MATIRGAEKGSERTAMERFGSGGMALLPWTKQMLTVLWEQLRLLVQVIYYTFMSVCQLFRLEVHLRITDESGQHIQHMTAASQTDAFLFSSLFDGENGMMVGGSNPLSNFCADVSDPFAGKSTAKALLSGLRADDLCCGLVDDFVSRTSGQEDGVFLGHQSTWKMGFPADWNIFLSSSDSSNDGCHKNCEKEEVFKQDTSEEERSPHWSNEEDQNVEEFDSEESKALWESLSRSSDPYNPFFFSACISTNTNMGKNKSETEEGSSTDFMPVSKAIEEELEPPRLNVWVRRSDSESSWSSSSSSDSSSPDIDKDESERLLELFNSPDDPYNPMCFTACTVSIKSTKTTSRSNTDTEEKTSSFSSSSDDDEEAQSLWTSFSLRDDPYHPLNFQACLQSPPTTPAPQFKKVPAPFNSETPPTKSKGSEKEAKTLQKVQTTKPTLQQREFKHHSHPDTILVPWKRPRQSSPASTQDRKDKTSSTQKKVRFSPLIDVHVMHTWLFAQRQSRKGPWEEMARDRDRFQRRIQETERAIGHIFTQSHREKIRAFLDGALK